MGVHVYTSSALSAKMSYSSTFGLSWISSIHIETESSAFGIHLFVGPQFQLSSYAIVTASVSHQVKGLRRSTNQHFHWRIGPFILQSFTCLNLSWLRSASWSEFSSRYRLFRMGLCLVSRVWGALNFHVFFILFCLFLNLLGVGYLFGKLGFWTCHSVHVLWLTQTSNKNNPYALKAF